jgi:hypothetical protein
VLLQAARLPFQASCKITRMGNTKRWPHNAEFRSPRIQSPECQPLYPIGPLAFCSCLDGKSLMCVSCAPEHKDEPGAQRCAQACTNARTGARARRPSGSCCTGRAARFSPRVCPSPRSAASSPRPLAVPSRGAVPFSKRPQGAEQTRMPGGAAPSATLLRLPGRMQAFSHMQVRAPARPCQAAWWRTADYGKTSQKARNILQQLRSKARVLATLRRL